MPIDDTSHIPAGQRTDAWFRGQKDFQEGKGFSENPYYHENEELGHESENHCQWWDGWHTTRS